MLVARLVAWLFLPLSICLELLVVGLLLLWFTRRQRLGKILVTTGASLLVLFSFGPFDSFLVESGAGNRSSAPHRSIGGK